MNKVYAIFGPPASGKTTIVKRLKDYGIPVLVSHTTRTPKNGEENGVDYYFIGKEEFTAKHFLEKVSYSGQYYGLSKDEVLNKVNAQPVSVVDISAHGLEQLKRLLGRRLESIYILVDKDVALSRALLQGDSMVDVQKKIEYAETAGEFNHWRIADYVVKNTGSVDAAVRQVLAVMDLVIPKPADHADKEQDQS
jgi:guanylate kinase